MTVTQSKEGQPFLPDLIKAISERYRFQKFPSSYEDLISESRTFQLGVWDKIQIEEMSVYNDGIIFYARAPTDFLENFCEDLLKFASNEFGMESIKTSERRHYESAIVAKLDPNVTKKFEFLDALNSDLAKFQNSYGLGSYAFAPASIESSVDVTAAAGKRPISFTLIRRVDVPFDEGVWFSAAPLKTRDHVSILERLEKLMLS